MTALETVPLQTPTLADDGPGNRWSRWSDRLNPILVREVQQAIKGRAFVLTVFLALLVSVIIAIAAASEQQRNGGGGRIAFDAGLATLSPLLLFVVPMGAYTSMRLELRGGIVEQLLLTELRPWRIITGKLLAAMVQFVLYVAVLAPLLAASYLLRGVDLPTIALSLLGALLFCLAATSFAISSAAQAMLPALQGITNLAVALGLGIASAGLVGYIGSGVYVKDLGWLLRSNEFGIVTSLMACGGLSGVVLSGLIAQSFLAHAFENRSTGFRVYLLGMVLLAYGWMWAFVDAAMWTDIAPAITFFLILLGGVFGVFMVTEQQPLSPRVRAHVPRSLVLAALATPFLPGRDRGMVFLVLHLGIVGACAMLFWPTIAPGHFLHDIARMIGFTAAYVILYLALGKWLRGKLPSSVLGNHLARFLVPFLVFAFSIVPVLLDVVIRGSTGNWHLGHVMDPFFTIALHAFDRRGGDDDVLEYVGIAAAVALLLQLPAFVRGLREVLTAARARAERKAIAAGNGDAA